MSESVYMFVWVCVRWVSVCVYVCERGGGKKNFAQEFFLPKFVARYRKKYSKMKIFFVAETLDFTEILPQMLFFTIKKT